MREAIAKFSLGPFYIDVAARDRCGFDKAIAALTKLRVEVDEMQAEIL